MARAPETPAGGDGAAGHPASGEAARGDSLTVPLLRYRDDLPGLQRAHADDAGADLVAVAAGEIAPGDTVRVPTNAAVALPAGYYGLVSGRSSLASAGILTHIGTLDAGYRGQIQVVLTNLGNVTYRYEAGHRIAQLIVLPFAVPTFVEVEQLPPSARGDRGFGSSGR